MRWRSSRADKPPSELAAARNGGHRSLSLSSRLLHTLAGAFLAYCVCIVRDSRACASSAAPSLSTTTAAAARPSAAELASPPLRPSAAFRTASSPPPEQADTAWCSSSPPTTGSELSVKDVAFGILTAKNLVQSRVHAQQLSWLPQARDVVFYSEADLEALQPTVALEPPPKEELVGGGAWKNFPALMDLHKRFPRHAWIFFCDDDTYVYMGNLLAMLGSYHAERDWYIGLYWTPRIDMEWKEVHIAYASGGAGYALSRPMLARLSETMPQCHTRYTRWAGDIRVGKCVNDLGVRVRAEAGFHHEAHDKYEWDNTGGGHPYGHLSHKASAHKRPPITFHHLQPTQLELYYRMQFVRHRRPDGAVEAYDFGEFMLREFSGYSPQLRQHVRLLFGFSVELSGGGPRDAPNWRKDFSDPLYLRRLSADESSGEASFSLVVAKVPNVFDGDGCDVPLADTHRAPARQAADVRLQCTPCASAMVGGHLQPLLGQLCDVQRRDSCTLELVVSLPCPEPQLVKAVVFDLGTAPGAADVVSMGSAACDGRSAVRLRRGVLSQDSPLALHPSVSHGSVDTLPATATADVPGCRALLGGSVELSSGGRLARGRSNLPPLTLACDCDAALVPPSARAAAPQGGSLAAAAAPPLRADGVAGGGGAVGVNLTLTLGLADFTSPTIAVAAACPLVHRAAARLR